MFVEQVLRLESNIPVSGTYIISDLKLSPFSNKDGHFLTFNLQDKSGTVWAKIWDNAEYIIQRLQDEQISIVDISGRTNIYNGKCQLIVEKVKKSEEYNMSDLIKVSKNVPEDLWAEIKLLMEENLKGDYYIIWDKISNCEEFKKKFLIWPGGKGTTHHMFQTGLIEHTCSVIKTAFKIALTTSVQIDFQKLLLGAFFHDLGKIESYDYDGIKTNASTIGRLHQHLPLSYYFFRKTVEDLSLKNKQEIIEEIGHIVLSHHGKLNSAVVPMTIEAKIVSYVDNLDADISHIEEQTNEHSDEQGWFFDNLNGQFLFKRNKIKEIEKMSEEEKPKFKRRKVT